MYSYKQILPERAHKSRIMNSIQGLGKTNYRVKRNRRYIIHNVKYHLTCTSFSTCNCWLANCLQTFFIIEMDHEERSTSTCFYATEKQCFARDILSQCLILAFTQKYGEVSLCFGFFPKPIVRSHWTPLLRKVVGCPEQLCMPHLWRHPQPGWMEL